MTTTAYIVLATSVAVAVALFAIMIYLDRRQGR